MEDCVGLGGPRWHRGREVGGFVRGVGGGDLGCLPFYVGFWRKGGGLELAGFAACVCV